MQDLRYDLSGNFAGSLLTFITIPLGLLYPLSMTFYLWKSPDPSSPHTSSLIERLNPATLSTRICHLLELLRLYLTVCFLVSFRDTPSLQILFLYLLTLAKQAYLLTLCPFAAPRDNLVALINEGLVTLSLMVYMGLAQCDSDSDVGV